MEIGHALAVDLHGFHLARLLDEELCEDTHARADLENREVGAGVDSVGDAARNVEVGEKVLPQILLGSYLFHDACL